MIKLEGVGADNFGLESFRDLDCQLALPDSGRSSKDVELKRFQPEKRNPLSLEAKAGFKHCWRNFRQRAQYQEFSRH